MREVMLVAAVGLLSAATPQRIVSTAPSITEILFALGLGGRVSGVTTYCRYPPEAQAKPKIGNFIRPDIEAILALRPDLVIIQKNPIRLKQQLDAVKLNVMEVDNDDVPGIDAAIREIGRAAGVPRAAEELTVRIQKGLEDVRRRTGGLPRRRVMFVVGRVPETVEGLIACGGASYLDEVMRIAGGDNLFHDAPAAYPKVSLEEVLARDPEVIVDMGDSTHQGAATEAHRNSVVKLWARYPSLAAVRRRAVFPVASDAFVVPGPRVVEAARAFGRMFHPEAGW